MIRDDYGLPVSDAWRNPAPPVQRRHDPAEAWRILEDVADDEYRKAGGRG